MIFSKRLIAGIRHISSDCAGEIEIEDGENLKEILAETAIDASRLVVWGYEDAHKEVQALIKEHGYQAVLSKTVEFITTY